MVEGFLLIDRVRGGVGVFVGKLVIVVGIILFLEGRGGIIDFWEG